MFSYPLIVRDSVRPLWPTAPSGGAEPDIDRDQDASRERWLTACVERLRDLRPHDDLRGLRALARALWADVSGFDPILAAEMEHESGLAGD